MRFTRHFRRLVLLLILNMASHFLPAQDAPSLRDTVDWLQGRLRNWSATSYNFAGGSSVSTLKFLSAEFPVDGGYTSGGTQGCMLVLRQQSSWYDPTVPGANGTNPVEEYRLYFNLMYYSVKTYFAPQSRWYGIMLRAAVSPNGSNGPFAFWENSQGRAQSELDLVFATTQEDDDRMANAFSNLIRLCGGKREAF